MMMHTLCDFVGTKNVAREMKKITEGRVRDKGVMWFPGLIDKSKHRILIQLHS